MIIGIILISSLIIIALACLFILLAPVIMELTRDLAKDFWAVRIAWQEGKEKYMEHIESHK